jgi:hypothetical protein
MLRAWCAPALVFLACHRPTADAARLSDRDSGVPAASVSAADRPAPWGGADGRFESGYAGTLGGKLAFRAELVKDGGALSGYYRYVHRSADLSLAGEVAEDGTFALVETAPDGRVTGKFAGTFTSPRAASGIWSSPDGSRRLPFEMKVAAPLQPTGGPIVFEEYAEERDAGAGCKNTVLRPSAVGLVPESRKRALNALFEKLAMTTARTHEVHCDGAGHNLPWSSESAVTIEAQAPPFVALEISWSGYSGGAHGFAGASCVLVDTETAREVSLAEVLGSAAIASLSRDLESQLAAFWKDNGLEPPHERPDPAAHLCYVSATEIDARFNEYEVAPYAAGPQQFVIDAQPLVEQMPAGRARRALFGPTSR